MEGRPERSDEGFPTTLRIAFAAGERPYAFWVSQRSDPGARFKVLSKRLPDRSLDVLVVEEPPSARPRGIARLDVPATAPSGWLDHWVQTLGRDLGVEFVRFDVSSVANVEEWRAHVRRMGWGVDA